MVSGEKMNQGYFVGDLAVEAQLVMTVTLSATVRQVSAFATQFEVSSSQPGEY